MKDIKNFLTEANTNQWKCDRDMQWKADSMFICFTPAWQMYGFCSKRDIENLDEYYSPADADINAILALNVGESIVIEENIYVRIKK